MVTRMTRLAPLACGIGIVMLMGDCVGAPEQRGVEREFDAAYRQWRGWLDGQLKLPRHKRGDPRKWFEHEAFNRMVSLGPPVVPHLVKRAKDDELLGHALYRVTKVRWHWEPLPEDRKKFRVEELPGKILNAPPDPRKMCQLWWNEWRKETPQRYTRLRQEWQTLKAKGETKAAAAKLDRIIDLGIDALPLLVADIADGEPDLVVVVSRLTDGAVSRNASPAQCVAWWRDNKSRWTIPDK